MAKHVRRAMLPGNNEVFKKSLAEGIRCGRIAWKLYHNVICAIRQIWMVNRYLISTGLILLMP